MKFDQTGVIMLASGLSTRFKFSGINNKRDLSSGLSSDIAPEKIPNKLLAPLKGKVVAEHSAACIVEAGIKNRIAVVPAGEFDLHHLYKDYSFSLCYNNNPSLGQGVSLGLGAAAMSMRSVEQVFVCLADMPLITPSMLHALEAGLSNNDAAICAQGGVMTPPALFRAGLLSSMIKLTGDQGARALLRKLDHVAYVEVPETGVRDIDCLDDLARIEEESHEL